MKDKKQRIKEAAIELFCNQGFQQTSTATISKKAGVATGTLFLYYKGKDELIIGLYQECKQALTQHLLQSIPSKSNFTEQLAQMWGHMVHWCIANPYEYQFIQMCKNSKYLRLNVVDASWENADELMQFLSNGIAKAPLHVQDIDWFLHTVDAMLSATISYCEQHPEKPIESSVQESFMLLKRALGLQ